MFRYLRFFFFFVFIRPKRFVLQINLRRRVYFGKVSFLSKRSAIAKHASVSHVSSVTLFDATILSPNRLIYFIYLFFYRKNYPFRQYHVNERDEKHETNYALYVFHSKRKNETEFTISNGV